MMAAEDVDLSFAVTLPPAEAVRLFESKGYAITWGWREAWQDAHTPRGVVAVVGVDIDEAGGHQGAAGIDLAPRLGMDARCDVADSAVVNGDVRGESGLPGAIHYLAAFD